MPWCCRRKREGRVVPGDAEDEANDSSDDADQNEAEVPAQAENGGGPAAASPGTCGVLVVELCLLS